jgi:hypothetical protein
VLTRIARDTVISCFVLAVAMYAWRRTWAAPLGVLGGGALIGLSYWAIWGGLEGWIPAHRSLGEGGRPWVFSLVKFFTRYGMLALAAYGMLVRLHWDPLGMLLGVSSLGVAVGVEALRKT